MAAHVQTTNASSSKLTDDLEKRPTSSTRFSKRACLEVRENYIRNTVNKWFGPLELLDHTARAGQHAHHEAVLQTLLRLHRLSFGFVPAKELMPVPEQDVLSAIRILNRIAITLKSPATAIVSYCEARGMREKNPRTNRLDPLQLRHLLCFHKDMSPAELYTFDIQSLKSACEQNDHRAIEAWFEIIANKKTSLPRDTPQFLRQLSTDLWNAGHRDYLKTFATKLAVLDSALFDTLGWENTRLFYATFKRIQGSECQPASVFLDDEDIAVAIAQYEYLGDFDQAIHFRGLSTTRDPQALRRLESMIIGVAKEQSSRIRGATASPFGMLSSTLMPKPVPHQPAAASALRIISRKNVFAII
jgi:hypothetical protein